VSSRSVGTTALSWVPEFRFSSLRMPPTTDDRGPRRAQRLKWLGPTPAGAAILSTGCYFHSLSAVRTPVKRSRASPERDRPGRDAARKLGGGAGGQARPHPGTRQHAPDERRAGRLGTRALHGEISDLAVLACREAVERR
jgi:hypothetical protein